MVNKFGDSSFISLDFFKNIEIVKKVKETSGKYKKYSDEIQASIKLGFTPYRIASEKSPTQLFVYNNEVWCLGTDGKVIELISKEVITEKNYLIYWKEGDLDDGDQAIVVKGDKGSRGEKGDRGDSGASGPRGEKGVAGARGEKGSHGEKGDSGSAGPRGEKGVDGPRGVSGKRGATGGIGAAGPPGKIGKDGPQGEIGPRGLIGTTGERGVEGQKGNAGRQGSRGQKGIQGEKGVQGDVGHKGEMGSRGQQGMQGHQGIQGERGKIGHPGKSTSETDILRVIVTHIAAPEVLKNFQKNCCLIYYHVETEDDVVYWDYKWMVKRIINKITENKKIRLHDATQEVKDHMAILDYENYPSRNLLQEKKNFLRTFQDERIGHKYDISGLRYYLTFHNKDWYNVPLPTDHMNHIAIFIVYKLNAYHDTNVQHECNYLWSSGTGKSLRGVCFKGDMKTLRIHGAVDKQKLTNYIDITNFGEGERNPCVIHKWNVLCVEYNTRLETTSRLWVNGFQTADFECTSGLSIPDKLVLGSTQKKPIPKSHFLDGIIASFELYNTGIELLLVEKKMAYLCEYFEIEM